MRSLVLVFLACATAYGANPPTKQPTKRPPDLVRGQTLYQRHCLSCHGEDAQGQGPATADLLFEVPPVEAEGFLVNNELVNVVLDGRKLMPSYHASFDKYDAKRVLRYMKELAIAGSWVELSATGQIQDKAAQKPSAEKAPENDKEPAGQTPDIKTP